MIDLERLAADPSLVPDEDLRRCLRTVLTRGRGALLDYAEPAGYRPLREIVVLCLVRVDLVDEHHARRHDARRVLRVEDPVR